MLNASPVLDRTSARSVEWRDLAACRGYSLALFFPPNGHLTSEAEQICGSCPVAAACLADAMRWPADEDHGILAGTTQPERKQLRRATTQAAKR